MSADLSTTDTPPFSDLTAQLYDGTVEQRVRAARALQAYGSQAVEPLLFALKDKEQPVRLAAAEVLGELGDDRAVLPLLDTLRDCFPGKSPRRYRISGVALLVTGTLAVVAGGLMAIFAGAPTAGDVAQGVLNAPVGGGKDAVNPTTQTCATALAKIADRSSSPELQEAVPHLKEIAADSVLMGKKARAASRRAVRKIERVTRTLEKTTRTT